MDSRQCRIAVDTRMVHHSGIGTYLQNLLPRMMEMRPDIIFYLMGKREDLSEHRWSSARNASIVECTSSIYSPAEQLEIPAKLPREAATFWSPHYIIPAFLHRRTVVTIHDVFHLAMPNLVQGVHKQLYAKGMFRLIASRAQVIICPSEFTMGEVCRLTSVRSERMHLVHNGIDEGWFDCRKDQNPYHKPFLLYVGNVKPHKNLTALLSAFAMICDKIPHHVVIVGKKEGFITGDGAIDAQTAKLGDRVHFTGIVPLEKLKQYYLHAECMVFPSLYEGFGLPPLEAMAAGCPVLTSNAASLPEVCGDAALYFDPRNPEEIAHRIVALVDDEPLKAVLREKGRKHAAGFSWDKAASSTLSLISNL